MTALVHEPQGRVNKIESEVVLQVSATGSSAGLPALCVSSEEGAFFDHARELAQALVLRQPFSLASGEGSGARALHVYRKTP